MNVLQPGVIKEKRHGIQISMQIKMYLKYIYKNVPCI